MAEKFLMPKLSPTMEEGQISRWVKNEGDAYEGGETLAEVDTDKATMEMTALSGGTLLKILKQAGESAALGETIAITGEPGEDISALLSEPPASAGGQKAATNGNAETRGPAGGQQSEPPATTGGSDKSNGRTLISPIAARMAAENSIDLKSLSGTGPNGRIIKRDVEQALSGTGQQDAGRSSHFTPSTQVGASAYRDETTSKMRQVIASRLAESIGPIPTFYLTVEIEMDNALALRKQVNASVAEDQKISFNDIVVKSRRYGAHQASFRKFELSG